MGAKLRVCLGTFLTFQYKRAKCVIKSRKKSDSILETNLIVLPKKLEAVCSTVTWRTTLPYGSRIITFTFRCFMISCSCTYIRYQHAFDPQKYMQNVNKNRHIRHELTTLKIQRLITYISLLLRRAFCRITLIITPTNALT